MPDCSARSPRIESRCRQLCSSHNHCDLQPWTRAVCTFTAVPMSTQPSTLHGTVNEYQLSGWVIIVNGDGGCRLYSCVKQADSQPKSCGLVWGSAAAWRCSTFTRWTEWTLAMTWSWWQQYKCRRGYYYYYCYYYQYKSTVHSKIRKPLPPTVEDHMASFTVQVWYISQRRPGSRNGTALKCK